MGNNVDPFKISLDDFLRLTDAEHKEIFRKAAEANSEAVIAYFQNNPEANWVIIAHSPGNVVDYGEGVQPGAEYVADIAKFENVPVFFYPRPSVSDEFKL
jgi:hypothetical protein